MLTHRLVSSNSDTRYASTLGVRLANTNRDVEQLEVIPLLKRTNRGTLETKMGLEVLCYFPDQTLVLLERSTKLGVGVLPGKEVYESTVRWTSGNAGSRGVPQSLK